MHVWTERHRPAIGRLGIGGTRKLSWPRPHAPQVGKSRGAAAGAVDGLAPCYGRHAPVAPVQMQYQSRALRQRPPAAALRHGGLPGPGQRQDPDALPAASCPIIFCHVRPATESTAGPAAGCLRALAGLLPRHSRRDCLARYVHRPRLRQVVAQGGGRQWRPVQGRRCAILRPSSRSPPRRGRGRCVGAAQSGPVRVPCGAAIVPLCASGSARGRSDSRSVVELEEKFPLAVLNHLANRRFENVRAGEDAVPCDHLLRQGVVQRLRCQEGVRVRQSHDAGL